VTKKLLTFVGYHENRVQFSWVSAAEGPKFAKVVAKVTEDIKKLGPLHRFKKENFKNGLFKQIQEIATKLFAENKIDYFVGYKQNSFDDSQVPFLITDPAEIPKLVFTDKSVFNLTNYLKPDHTKRKRVGLV